MSFAEQFHSTLNPHLQGGRADALSFAVTSVRLRGEMFLELPASGVTAVVGPNNGGKSTLLREISQALSEAPGSTAAPRRSVDSVAATMTGEQNDAVAWLLDHARVQILEGSTALVSFSTKSGPLSSVWLNHQMTYQWPAALTGQLGPELHPFFVHYAGAEDRLMQSREIPAREDARGPATHPLHALEDDRSLVTQASQIAQIAFGVPLHLDDFSNSRRLKVGRLAVPAPSRDSNDNSYRNALLDLPDLAEQGDGMRSFFGQLLPLLVRSYPFALIDEPEAFLHPPQAAHLGATLGKLVRDSGMQLVLATHDRHLLTGLLGSGVDLSVVRVDHNVSGFTAKQLSAEDLRSVWSQPVLRYSNALDGLFHRLVVLVESENDARFYAAALDAAAERGDLGLAATDVLFVPCSGKGGMPKLADALVRLGVPVVATPDLDILQERSLLKSLVTALGGDWTTLDTDYTQAVAGLHKDSAPLAVKDLVDVLGADTSAPLDNDRRQAVQRLLSTVGTGWQHVKRSGLSALGGGNSGAAAVRLTNALENVGIVVVREGELESFEHSLGVGKNRWLAAALEAGVPSNDAAIGHVRRIVSAGLRH